MPIVMSKMHAAQMTSGQWLREGNSRFMLGRLPVSGAHCQAPF
jgi:hypothetical protein